MNIKQKLQNVKSKLKKRSIELATFTLTMLPSQSGMSAPNAEKNVGNQKSLSIEAQLEASSASDILQNGITLGVGELKKILTNNPELQLSSDYLEGIIPGPSQKKIYDRLSKGFTYTVTNSRGVSKKVKCSLHKKPQGYCYGAMKALLLDIFKEAKSGYLSAYQEKDKLSQSKNFMSLTVGIDEIKNCPPNTVVVIPKCKGHPHGHIFIVVEKGVYCSDGKELDGEYFQNNYKAAKEAYAFVPVDGSITLTPELLQKSTKLFAAVANYVDENEIQNNTFGAKSNEPLLYAEFSSAPKSNDFSR